jgi:signal transduction histidine kinase
MRLIRFIVLAAIWTVIGGIFALPFMLRGGGFGAMFAVMINWQLWGLLTPLIRAFDARLPFPRTRWLSLIGAHFLFGTGLAAAYVAVASGLEYGLGLNTWAPWSQPVSMLDWFLWSMLMYALFTGAWQAVKYYRWHLRDELRIERLERNHAEAQLLLLRARLDPHFLFNALNGISADLERDPRTSRAMIEHLADLLRFSLKSQESQFISLDEELAFVEAYAALQKMRFGDRLDVHVEVAPSVGSPQIPSLLLQPLIENAIRHGISRRIEGGAVTVTILRDETDFLFRVTDTGAGLPSGWDLDGQAGTGLSATRARLRALYPGPGDRLSLRPGAPEGVIAEIRIPADTQTRTQHVA